MSDFDLNEQQKEVTKKLDSFCESITKLAQAEKISISGVASYRSSINLDDGIIMAAFADRGTSKISTLAKIQALEKLLGDEITYMRDCLKDESDDIKKGFEEFILSLNSRNGENKGIFIEKGISEKEAQEDTSLENYYTDLANKFNNKD